MSTENIVKFLQTAYSDERLAALLAHAQDGKLAFNSCCCFIGVSNADHALKPKYPEWWAGTWLDGTSNPHIVRARSLPFSKQAENEFAELGDDDDERRAAIIPLILAEMERRTPSPVTEDEHQELQVV